MTHVYEGGLPNLSTSFSRDRHVSCPGTEVANSDFRDATANKTAVRLHRTPPVQPRSTGGRPPTAIEPPNLRPHPIPPAPPGGPYHTDPPGPNCTCHTAQKRDGTTRSRTRAQAQAPLRTCIRGPPRPLPPEAASTARGTLQGLAKLQLAAQQLKPAQCGLQIPKIHSAAWRMNSATHATPLEQRHRDSGSVGTKNTSSGHRAIKTRKCQETMIVS